MNIAVQTRRRTVLSYGTFDLSLPSESQHLRTLSNMGDELILGCATDAFADLHGLDTITDYAQRRVLLEHCRYVDRVIAQKTIGQIRTDIVNYNVCVFAMDDAWAGQFDDLQDITQVVYLPRPGGLVSRQRVAAMDPQMYRIAV